MSLVRIYFRAMVIEYGLASCMLDALNDPAVFCSYALRQQTVDATSSTYITQSDRLGLSQANDTIKHINFAFPGICPVQFNHLHSIPSQTTRPKPKRPM